MKKMYHASPFKFDFPKHESIYEKRTGHVNGLLGLWVSTTNDWCQNFGTNIYEVEFEGVGYAMPVTELKDLGDDEDFMNLTRSEFYTHGIDYIEIVEITGQIDMGVIVNLKCIKNFTLMSPDK